MDFFLDDNNCVSRLFEEWQKYNSLIVAYDFDNTVFDYYHKGHTFGDVIELLRECHKLGFYLTVFTSCSEDRYPEIIKYLEDNDIPFNSINDSPEYIPFKGRKIYYNVFLDDRAGLSSAYTQLWRVIYNIRGLKHSQNITDVA
ncbi:MAG: hypothetical protein IT243_05030 [Bacteroidia bacterium]|nr:hypothetical protein [Bacteroidia bacterium]